eukprot:gene38233-51646_t
MWDKLGNVNEAVLANYLKNHGDRLGVFVLQIVGEDGLVHIAELVPHGPAGRTADFLHQPFDAVGGHERGQQALGLVEAAHDRAGAGHARDKLDQQLLHDRRTDGAQTGHGLGDFLDLVVVEPLPQTGVLLAERQQDDRGLLRTGQFLGVVD